MKILIIFISAIMSVISPNSAGSSKNIASPRVSVVNDSNREIATCPPGLTHGSDEYIVKGLAESKNREEFLTKLNNYLDAMKDCCAAKAASIKIKGIENIQPPLLNADHPDIKDKGFIAILSYIMETITDALETIGKFVQESNEISCILQAQINAIHPEYRSILEANKTELEIIEKRYVALHNEQHPKMLSKDRKSQMLSKDLKSLLNHIPPDKCKLIELLSNNAAAFNKWINIPILYIQGQNQSLIEEFINGQAFLIKEVIDMKVLTSGRSRQSVARRKKVTEQDAEITAQAAEIAYLKKQLKEVINIEVVTSGRSARDVARMNKAKAAWMKKVEPDAAISAQAAEIAYLKDQLLKIQGKNELLREEFIQSEELLLIKEVNNNHRRARRISGKKRQKEAWRRTHHPELPGLVSRELQQQEAD